MKPLLTFLLLQVNESTVEFFSLKEADPEPNFFVFLLNAFIFIAVALGATLVAGVALGGFRLWLLRRFPNNPINGTDEDDVTHTFRLND